MCGIAAIAGVKVKQNNYNTSKMLNVLQSRGPDDSGEKEYEFCWLGHRRLSIVDLDNGLQPMVDKEIAISFNGEIYNNDELRNILKKDGYRFKTKSDTETILKAYQKWGSDCPKYIDGMFSFVIWDDRQKELFLARDRFGKKPLYYCFDGEAILVASEIKSLIASGKVHAKIDRTAIDNYLRVMYIPTWKSVYENIFQLPPAHFGIFKDGKLKTDRYWKVIQKPINVSYEKAKSEVHRLLRKAVKKRLETSDVEVGAFLSGGIDSTLIALIAAEELKQPLKVFSVSYGGSFDELPYAQQVCKKIKGSHFICHIDELLIDEVDKVLKYFDEPHADTSDFPQHLISKLAAQKVKVVLSGDGADELFFGYKWHLPVKENVSTRKNDLFERRVNSICAFDIGRRQKLWGSMKYINDEIQIADVYTKEQSPALKVATFDLTSHLPGQILSKVDRAGMMNSLEVRSPFLDTELVEYVYNLPNKYKIKYGHQKGLLKDILCEYMPHDFVYRQKQGFGSPVEQWLSGTKMKKYFYTQLGDESRIRQILSGDEIDKYLYDFYLSKNKPKRAGQRLWVLFCLERWLSQLK